MAEGPAPLGVSSQSANEVYSSKMLFVCSHKCPIYNKNCTLVYIANMRHHVCHKRRHESSQTATRTSSGASLRSEITNCVFPKVGQVRTWKEQPYTDENRPSAGTTGYNLPSSGTAGYNMPRSVTQDREQSPGSSRLGIRSALWSLGALNNVNIEWAQLSKCIAAIALPSSSS